MDKINTDLLFLHSENARAKIRDISKIFKRSPQRMKYTLKSFEKEGIVTHPYCIFDYSYFGLILFRVYFKGGYIGERDKANIIKKLNENPYVVSVCELNGEFDLVVEIESPNPSRFNKELKKITDIIPTLNDYKMILNLVTHIYPRAYLIKDEMLLHNTPNEIVIGGDRNVQDFTKNEMLIIKSLLKKPKLRFSSLAKEADLNVKTARSVLKNLQQKKIIRGFKYVLDTNKLDVSRSRILLKLHNVGQEREKELLDFMLKTKEVIQINKTTGDWDLEVDIGSFDKTKIRKLTVQLREDFRDIIDNFNIIELCQYYKKTFLPEYLFNKEVE